MATTRMAGDRTDTLIQGSDGNLCGLGSFGGTDGAGKVFRFSPLSNKFTTLHSFNQADGDEPIALVDSGGGLFYGDTASSNRSGTLFRITSSGSFGIVTSLPRSGSLPQSPSELVLDKQAGVLYGISQSGGLYQQGTFFGITLAGTLFSVFSFASAPTGTNVGGTLPSGALAIDSNGILYGTARQGGQFGNGTVFSYHAPQP